MKINMKITMKNINKKGKDNYSSLPFKLSVNLTDDIESINPDIRIPINKIKLIGVKQKAPNSIVKNIAVETITIAVPIKNTAMNNTNKNNLILLKNSFIFISFYLKK